MWIVEIHMDSSNLQWTISGDNSIQARNFVYLLHSTESQCSLWGHPIMRKCSTVKFVVSGVNVNHSPDISIYLTEEIQGDKDDTQTLPSPHKV